MKFYEGMLARIAAKKGRRNSVTVAEVTAWVAEYAEELGVPFPREIIIQDSVEIPGVVEVFYPEKDYEVLKN